MPKQRKPDSMLAYFRESLFVDRFMRRRKRVIYYMPRRAILKLV